MSTRRKLVRATGGMAALTAVSRVTGYLRDKTIAALLGAGVVSDAFYAGLAVPNMFRALLAEGALHAAFIPALSGLREEAAEERQREFVRAMMSSLLMILPLLVAGGMVGAPWLVRLAAHGFESDPAKLALAIRLTRLMFPYLGLISLAGLAQGVLNASGRFLLPAATPIFLNLAIMAGTAVAVTVFPGSWAWLAVGVVAGGALQLAVQLPACHRAGLPLVPGRRAFGHPEVRRVLALMAPGIPSLGIYQVTMLISLRFASTVGEGAVAARFNAARLNELVYGVLIVQLTTAVLPMLAAERIRDVAAARATLGFAIRLMFLVALPAAVFTTLMAKEITGTAFGGGAYTPADVRMTAGALAMYALGLPFLGLTKLLSGASYAWKNTVDPVIAASVNLGLFFGLGHVLTPMWGIAGIAAAASAGQLANASVLLALGGRARRLPPAGAVGPALLRQMVATCALAAAVIALHQVMPPLLSTGVRSLAWLGVAALVAGAAYLGALRLLDAEELREAGAFFGRRLSRKRGDGS